MSPASSVPELTASAPLRDIAHGLEYADDRGSRPWQALRRHPGGRRPVVHRAARPGDGFPGPERGGEVDDDAPDSRPRRPDHGGGDGPRTAGYHLSPSAVRG